MDLPKGENARVISLKCCLPKGIPIMVMQNSSPKSRCVRAIQKPPKISQMMFIAIDRQPVFKELFVILTPNGARPTIANLKHWMPKGIPIMVRHRMRPPKIYSKKIKSPPNMIQMRLPIKFICSFLLRCMA